MYNLVLEITLDVAPVSFGTAFADLQFVDRHTGGWLSGSTTSCLDLSLGKDELSRPHEVD